MDNKISSSLIERYLAGECTDAEKQAVEEWYDQFDRYPVEFLDGDPDEIRTARQSGFADIRQKLAERRMIVKPAKQEAPRRLGPLLAIAATVLVLAAGIWWLQRSPEKPAATTITAHKDLPPGGNRAILTLADGSQLVLDTAKAGNLATEGELKIVKVKDGQLAYIGGDQPTAGYNTISTPKGGQYEVLLADGSTVRLNAGSSVRFPTTFGKGERRVEITGEAFLEVSQQAGHPFVASAGGLDVQVLGTGFNLRAYSDEPAAATLATGKIKVGQGSRSVLLQPGEQATATSGALEVRKGMLPGATAWKDGYFHFERSDIKSIMRDVARWYDIEVYYEGPVTEQFFAKVSRQSTLFSVLKILETTGGVHFRLEGKRLYVKP